MSEGIRGLEGLYVARRMNTNSQLILSWNTGPLRRAALRLVAAHDAHA
jgi:hypothetical protein